MLTNEIKKGMRVELMNGWMGTMLDSKKGDIRMVEVEGVYTEVGSVYATDIVAVHTADGDIVMVTHTQAQLEARAMRRAAGF